MAQVKKDESIIYRCPMCLNRLVDVIIDEYDDGVFRCMKCGYTGSADAIMEKYDEFRSKYRLMNKRITLEEQRFIVHN